MKCAFCFYFELTLFSTYQTQVDTNRENAQNFDESVRLFQKYRLLKKFGDFRKVAKLLAPDDFDYDDDGFPIQMFKSNGDPCFQRDGDTPKFLFYRPTGGMNRPQNRLRNTKEKVFKKLRK